MKKVENFIIKKTEQIELNFYAVRSQDGKWYRSTGYGGGGEHWVDDISKAKLYGNPRGANTVVTYWATHYPEYGIPDVVRVGINRLEYIDQTDRVTESKKKRALKEAEFQVRRIKSQIDILLQRNIGTESQLKCLTDQLFEYTDKLEKLKKDA